MTPKAQQEAIKKFQLQSHIDAIGQEKFFQKLNKANKQTLESLSLADLQKTSKNILLPDEEFKKITMIKLEKTPRFQIKFIIDRFKNIKQEAYKDVIELTDIPNILNLKIIYFHSLKAEKINEFISKIPTSFFLFLSDAQIRGLNFSQISAEQLHHLFSVRNGLEERQRRFALLSTDQVNASVDKLLIANELQLLSEEHFKLLDTSKLSKRQVERLFPSFSKEALRQEYKAVYYHSTSKEEEIEKISQERKTKNTAILSLLSPTQIANIKDKLSQENLELIKNTVNHEMT